MVYSSKWGWIHGEERHRVKRQGVTRADAKWGPYTPAGMEVFKLPSSSLRVRIRLLSLDSCRTFCCCYVRFKISVLLDIYYLDVWRYREECPAA